MSATDTLELGVLIALVAWIVTNVQLIRTQRRIGKAQEAIRQEIETKRAQTQAFVETRLDAQAGRLEAVLRAEMPHPDVTIADMRRDLETKFTEMDRGLTAALGSIDQTFKGILGNMGQSELELRRELTNVEGEATSAIQEAYAAGDTTNPVVRRLYAWAAKPVDPKLEAKNPIGSAVLQLGKAALLDRLQDEMPGVGGLVRLKKGGNWNPGLK